MLEQNQIILRRRVNKRYLWRTNCKTDRGRKKTSADFVSPRRIKQFVSTKQKNPVSKAHEKLFFRFAPPGNERVKTPWRRETRFSSRIVKLIVPEGIFLRINTDTIALLIVRKKSTRQWKLTTKENYSKATQKLLLVSLTAKQGSSRD